MVFREFMMTLSDDITPEAAKEAYQVGEWAMAGHCGGHFVLEYYHLWGSAILL